MLNFNVHPLLVHFPIALLTVYSFLEFVPIKKITNLSWWFYVKAAFLSLGVLLAIPTGFAGKIIEGQFREKHALVNLHSHFAIAASAVYALIALIYLLAFLSRSKTQIKLPLPKIVIIILALVGLIIILITGALGGVIVYGANLDPFTAFVYHLFFR